MRSNESKYTFIKTLFGNGATFLTISTLSGVNCRPIRKVASPDKGYTLDDITQMRGNASPRVTSTMQTYPEGVAATITRRCHESN